VSVILLNDAHPFTLALLRAITIRLGAPPEVRAVARHVDRSRPLAEVAYELAEAAGLAADAWQTTPLALNPPAVAPVALALVAELHGRCGYVLPIVHLRPVAGSLPPRYEVAELADLQAMRDQARARR
jgi:hypothetical protein